MDENSAAFARLDTDNDELRRRYDDVQDKLVRINTELSKRLDALSERTHRTADVGPEGLLSLGRQLEETAARLPEALDALRTELQADVAAAVAEVRASIPEPSTGDARVDALERAVAERAGEVSDLLEYHAALDSGLGELRTELAKAVDAAAWASVKASSVGRLGKDVVALREQVAAQEEALTKVAKSIESLRRKIPAPAPATTKKASRPTK